MKILATIGWFVFDVLAWIVNFLVYVIKKAFRLIRRIFSAEAIRKHKVASALIAVVVIGGLLSWYFFIRKYEVVVIPKDSKDQSPIERSFLGALKRESSRDSDDQASGPAGVSPSSKRFYRGEVKTVEDKQFILKTDTGRDETIAVGANTGIFPADASLATGQSITVSTHPENGTNVADKIVIRKTPPTAPATAIED